MFFSNLIGEKGKVIGLFPISTLFTLTGISISLLLTNLKYAFASVLVILVTIINYILELGITLDLALIIIKLLSFVSLWISLDHVKVYSVYRSVLYAFVLSNICALLFIIFGLNEFRQILYPGFPPRYAAMAIEPAGFSLATLSLIYLYYLSTLNPSMRLRVAYYIPFIFAISSAILVKFLLDFTKQVSLRLNSLLVCTLLMISALIIWTTTRASLSIMTRIEIYRREIQLVDWTILGEGYAIEKYAALPGILKFPAESGLLFAFVVFAAIALLIVKHRSYRNVIIFPIVLTPFLTETYGAILLWTPIFIIIKNKHHAQ